MAATSTIHSAFSIFQADAGATSIQEHHQNLPIDHIPMSLAKLLPTYEMSKWKINTLHVFVNCCAAFSNLSVQIDVRQESTKSAPATLANGSGKIASLD
jgi:hypothetical protein